MPECFKVVQVNTQESKFNLFMHRLFIYSSKPLPRRPIRTSGGDASLAVVDVAPDDDDDGHERHGHAADVRQPVTRLQQQPRQDQHRRQAQAVQ